jgi:hypothetical protein
MQRLSKVGWLVTRTEVGVVVTEVEMTSSGRALVADLKMTSGEGAVMVEPWISTRPFPPPQFPQ